MTFASDLMGTVGGVLPENAPCTFIARVRPTKGGRASIAIAPENELGLPLTIDGQETFRLIATYACSASPTSEFLTVTNSTFKVNVDGSNMPLFTLDYHRDSSASVPSAHYNLHAKREDMVRALARAGNQGRGKIRRRDLRSGKYARFGDVHFPVGGDRFRPCLEDVLEMMLQEFGIDRSPGAHEALVAGRRSWRKMQLAAAVSDDPATAADELRRLGYAIGPNPVGMSERLDRTGTL